MSSEFLGVGWNFPIEVDEKHKIKMARYEDSIQQAIWMIVGTAKGERVMRRDFGCGIHDLVFAPNNATTAGQAIREVREALVLWEPRIDVLHVEAFSDPTQPYLLLIEISYLVRKTNNRFNLVYPFYLEIRD